MNLAFRPELAERYSSRSQIARILTQDWVGRELACLACSYSPLSATAQNTKARDFECPSCREPYELKSTSGRLGHHIADGEFETFLSAVRSERVPNLVLMEYDSSSLGVRNLLAVHRSLISEEAVIPRKPLSRSARRAGWQGCTINLDLIPKPARVEVVAQGIPVPWDHVVNAWSRFEFMIRLRPEVRAWHREILSFIQRLPPGQFDLRDLYQFKPELSLLHPGNHHIEEKIRQQLQVLERRGLVMRLKPGRYRVATPMAAPA